MSTTKLILAQYCRSLGEPKHRFRKRVLFLKSATDNVNNNKLLWGVKKHENISKFVCQPQHPPPSDLSKSRYNQKWILRVAMAVALPLLLNSEWASVLKLKSAVATAEQKLVTLKMVAVGVEKAAATIAIGIPKEYWWLKRGVEFVEHVAKTAHYDAYLLDVFLHEIENQLGVECEHLAEEISTDEHPEEEIYN